MLGNAQECRANKLRIQHQQVAPDVAPENRVSDWQSITRFETKINFEPLDLPECRRNPFEHLKTPVVD